MDIEKQLESLEKRIKELESKQKNSLSAFGKSYSQFGSSSSDLLLKTRGQVKIQYGSKFIDLIKDGKVNVDSKFIYVEDSIGSKDGIYIVGDKVYLVSGNNLIPLIGETGTTYVSFLGELETTAELKHTALTNIGFIYPDISSIDENSLSNGIIYIESENKLYFIKNKQLEEFKVNIPNPFTELLILSKKSDNVGAIRIEGSGKSNSIAFDKLYIYDLNIECDSNLTVDASNVEILCNTTIALNLTVGTIQNSSGGYKLYNQSGKGILEIDEIIYKNASNSDELWLAVQETILVNSEEDGKISLIFESENAYVAGDSFMYFENEEIKFFAITEVGEKGTYYTNQPLPDDDNSLLEPDDIVYSLKCPPIRMSPGNIDVMSVDNNTILPVINIGTTNSLIGINAKWGHAQYTDLPDSIPNDVNENSFAPIKWLTGGLFPNNSIILYKGETAPDGWALCNGINSTPNISSSINGVNYIIKI